MKVVLRNRQALKQSAPEVAAAIEEIVSGINTPPMEVGDAKIRSGTGTPEGRVTGNVGDLWLRTDGSTSTTLYVKCSGTNTMTGWVGK